MKITTQLLRSRAQKPLPGCEFLDLSNQKIDCIDKLYTCPKLQALNLRGNEIDYVSSLDHCPHLWKLDLSNNKIKNLDGIRRFVAFGTLVLSNNNLSWMELSKLRHMHILDLSLHGNYNLERDPYYRIHVIDTLPNIWMLDGRIVTSAERLQVEQFFQDSALTDHPVRHKFSKDKFTPSILKKIEVSGVFGERTDHLMRRFPVNGAVNIDTDRRRLRYLCYNIQEDLRLESSYMRRNYNVLSESGSFLEDLLAERSKDRVRCNMMLLLLVASLEFAVPVSLMQEVLSCTKLDSIGKTSSMHLFLLSRETRCLIVSLLLSAVKVDKDAGEEGGLYDKLYLCLYYSVTELTKLAQGVALSHSQNSKQYSFFRDSKCLIASEVVQLLCIVPAFFEFLVKDVGIMNLVAIATSDPSIVERLHSVMKTSELEGFDQKEMLEGVAEMILTAIQHNSISLINKQHSDKTTQANYVLNTKKAIPRRPMSSSLHNSDYLMSGRRSPEKRTARLKSGKHEHRPYLPMAKLGEKVLLGPQNVGRVISVPEPDLVLIQMDVVPAETGAMVQNTKNPSEHYMYVDMTQLYWDSSASYWRPKGTMGDRITIQQKDGKKTKSEHQSSILAGSSSKLDNTSAPPSSPRVPSSKTSSPPSQKLDLILQGSGQDSYTLPDSVSSRYKEQYNLKLEWKTVDRSEDVDSLAGESQAEPNRGGTAHSQHSCAVSALPVYGGEDDEFLYRNIQTAISTMKQTAQEAPPVIQPETVDCGVEGGSTLEDAHVNKVETEEQAPQPGGDPKPSDKQSDNKALNPKVSSSSRRSSLDSDFEPELESFVEASRPSTAHSRPATTATTKADRPSTAPNEIIGTPVLPIEIPQVGDENDDEDRSTRVNRKPVVKVKSEGERVSIPDSPLRISRKSKVHENNRINQARSAPRPISAVDTYRMVIPRDNKNYMTQYQSQRTEAWKAGSPTKEAPSRPESPPPQPPSSPSTKDKPSGSHVKVQRGALWLGGGKDLHWERQKQRPKTAHVPGWLEGMPQRPKSAAALRAMRRSKTPNINTPSSIAYESLYALDIDENVLDDIYCHPGSSPVPPTKDNQMQGSKLVSHPFAKYIYVMRERNKRQKTAMCAQCQELHRQQEEDLRQILGGDNSDLINKLVALEPCSHTPTVSEGGSEHLPAID